MSAQSSCTAWGPWGGGGVKEGGKAGKRAVHSMSWNHSIYLTVLATVYSYMHKGNVSRNMEGEKQNGGKGGHSGVQYEGGLGRNG